MKESDYVVGQPYYVERLTFAEVAELAEERNEGKESLYGIAVENAPAECAEIIFDSQSEEIIFLAADKIIIKVISY